MRYITFALQLRYFLRYFLNTFQAGLDCLFLIQEVIFIENVKSLSHQKV